MDKADRCHLINHLRKLGCYTIDPKYGRRRIEACTWLAEKIRELYL